MFLRPPISTRTDTLFPSTPLFRSIVVSTTPGSSPDTIARLVALGLTERMGQTVVVENRGGANGRIAVDVVNRAEPDGYTLLVTTRSEEHTSELQSLMRISYAVFCWKKKQQTI